MIRSLFQRLSGSLVGDAAIYIAAAAANAAIPFLLLPLIARWLGPSDFGIIGSFVAVVNVLILLVGLNAYGFVSVGYYRDGPGGLPRIVGAAIAIIIAASAAVGLAGAIGADTAERLAQIDRGWLWTLLAAATGQAIVSVGLTVAQTVRRPITYGVLQVGYGLLLTVSALILVGALGMGWTGRALAQVLAAGAVAAGAIVWLQSTRRITAAIDRGTVRRILRFGVPLLPHSLAAVAMASMDRLALGGSYGSVVVGHYFLALQISSVFTALAAAMNQAWVPWLYERLARNDDAAWAEIARTVRIGGALLALSAVAMAALAGPLVMLVGGSAYVPAIGPLRVLAVYAACQGWYTLISAFLFYSERIPTLSALTVSVAILQAVLIGIGVQWGAIGVAGALSLSSAAGAICISLVARRLAASHRSAGPVGSAASEPVPEIEPPVRPSPTAR